MSPKARHDHRWWKKSVQQATPLLPLTSLRFVAAAMILMHHWGQFGLPTVGLALAQGVTFFFVLSGFILTYRYPRFAAWEEVRRFLAFRVVRIWPAHAVTAVAAVFVFSATPFDIKFAANLAMVHAWVPSWPWYFSYNAVSWSISTEFGFYLAFPLLILAWARTWWWKFALCAALPVGLMVLGRDLNLPGVTPVDTASLQGLLYVSPLARLLEFVAGMTACLAYRSSIVRSERIPSWVFTVAEVVAISLFVWLIASHPLYALERFLPSNCRYYLGIADGMPGAVAIVFVFAFQRGLLSRILSVKPFLLLGDASYSLYLVHSMVFFVAAKSLGFQGIWAFVASSIASIALAFALWRVVETPANRAVRNLYRSDKSL